MDKNRKTHNPVEHFWWALTLALLLSVALPTNAQTTGQAPLPEPTRQTPPPSPAPPVNTMPEPLPGPSPSVPPDNGITRPELAAMGQFLEGHPEIAEQLEKDPSLINSKSFIDSHPELQEFLQSHPGVREEFSENPNAFMQAENRFEHYEASHDHITPQEVASMDRFLDKHPEITEALRKSPWLIDDQSFINSHPELKEYLQSHPGVRQAFDENPNAFMRDENRYDQQGDRDHDRDRDDITRRQLATMDRFLDSHPEIAEQLRKDPSLINSKQFVNNHPQLQEFLQSHPEVREEFKENPNAFMQAENRFDRHEDRNQGGDWDRDRREMGSFGEFLRGHSSTADALSKDPTLANNREFLATHSDLRDYLQAHPGMQQQLASNPQAVMTSPALAGNATMPGKGSTTTPSMKPDLPK